MWICHVSASKHNEHALWCPFSCGSCIHPWCQTIKSIPAGNFYAKITFPHHVAVTWCSMTNFFTVLFYSVFLMKFLALPKVLSPRTPQFGHAHLSVMALFRSHMPGNELNGIIQNSKSSILSRLPPLLNRNIYNPPQHWMHVGVRRGSARTQLLSFESYWRWSK